MLALYTRINELEAANANRSSSAALATSSNGAATISNTGGNDDFITGTKVKKWRIKYVTDKVKRDGREYWWCKYHVSQDPTWNGMYVTHKPQRCPKILTEKRMLPLLLPQLEATTATLPLSRI